MFAECMYSICSRMGADTMPLVNVEHPSIEMIIHVHSYLKFPEAYISKLPGFEDIHH